MTGEQAGRLVIAAIALIAICAMAAWFVGKI
jgi:hypothetical protein